MLPETYGLRGAVWADAAVISGAGASGVPIDAGTDAALKSSIGASILWDSPFGPLRGDLAFPLNKANGDKTSYVGLTLQTLL